MSGRTLAEKILIAHLDDPASKPERGKTVADLAPGDFQELSLELLAGGRIVASGGADLALKLEEQGYAWLEQGFVGQGFQDPKQTFSAGIQLIENPQRVNELLASHFYAIMLQQDVRAAA